jgi:general secretion pathway protein J
MTIPADRRRGEGGFTLIEALVALALTGLVLSALANLTAQWLPNWNRGLDRIQRSEMVGITLQRLADDLADALPVPASASDMGPFFSGSEQSITFVRTALGPNAGPELDVVHLGETNDKAGLATVRSRTQFRPMPPNASASNQFHFREPVVLLRAPYRLTFAYAGDDDEEWQSSWRDPSKLPSRIKLTVRDSSNGRAISTVTSIHVQSPPQDDGNASVPGNQNGAPQANSSNPSQPAVGQGNAR